VSERLRVGGIGDGEGARLLRIVRRGTGSVVTWRRAQMVLLSAQGMSPVAIAKVAFTSEDRVRDVIRNFNADGFSSLYPKYGGGHPPKFAITRPLGETEYPDQPVHRGACVLVQEIGNDLRVLAIFRHWSRYRFAMRGLRLGRATLC
jgi:hypothetical protein